MGHSGRIYTTETGKHCKSQVLVGKGFMGEPEGTEERKLLHG